MKALHHLGVTELGKALADGDEHTATVKLARALTHMDDLATASTVQSEQKPGFLRRAR